ncbi:hypothetical protein GA0115244_11559 [Streptomyces sp. DvalAA-19]|nr:hypothetical protein GA0115244_11559 [Streptomyces sp. DvalAA-19]
MLPTRRPTAVLPTRLPRPATHPCPPPRPTRDTRRRRGIQSRPPAPA